MSLDESSQRLLHKPKTDIFLNLATNIAMVPESDAKLQAEQRVYHWLNVRLCCSILHTNYITGCCRHDNNDTGQVVLGCNEKAVSGVVASLGELIWVGADGNVG